jgi:hypothetical protein
MQHCKPHFTESHTRYRLIYFKLSVLSRKYFPDRYNYWENITTWYVISFSAFECATLPYTWRIAEYSGGNSPWFTACRDPHIWRPAWQHGENCIIRYWDTAGLWKYHYVFCEMGFERSAKLSEVRKFWMHEIKALIFSKTLVAQLNVAFQ